MAPNDPSTDDIQANADLLRRFVAAIGLTGAMLVEVCERIVADSEARAVSDASPRCTTSPSEGMGDR